MTKSKLLQILNYVFCVLVAALGLTLGILESFGIAPNWLYLVFAVALTLALVFNSLIQDLYIKALTNMPIKKPNKRR